MQRMSSRTCQGGSPMATDTTTRCRVIGAILPTDGGQELDLPDPLLRELGYVEGVSSVRVTVEDGRVILLQAAEQAPMILGDLAERKGDNDPTPS